MNHVRKKVVVAAAIASLVVAPFLQAIAAGIGLTGPDQHFTLVQGSSASSYMVVWNEGDSTGTFAVECEGGIVGMVAPSPGTLTLSPGSSGRVNILYNVPAGQPEGTYSGQIIVSMTGTTISPAASREVMLAVTAGTSSGIQLRRGLNLVSWPGASGAFDILIVDPELYKVWRRKADGAYVYAQYYEGDGWWSSDSSFTGLETGGAYFFELTADCAITLQESAPPPSFHLDSGLNLMGWCYDTMSLDEAFPQGPTNYYVEKVWKRFADGEYIFASYYPETDAWWSSDPSFTMLEKGSAYFVEALEEVDISP